MSIYPGGKNGAGVYQCICNQMPPHAVYVEPFFGSGALLRVKRPAALNIGIDMDPRAIAAARAMFGDTSGPLADSVTSALALPSTHAASGDSAGTMLASLRRCRSTASGEAVPEFHLATGDGITFLEQYEFRGDELVYCDPPYLRSVRSSARDIYACEMTDVDHRRLLRVLKKLPCYVILSGYWSPLYAKALKNWRTVTYTAGTRGGPATEWLWCNYPEPVRLHDYRYLGATWRERARIIKKKKRWCAKLTKMPLLERQALYAAIATHAEGGAGGSLQGGNGDATRLRGVLSAPEGRKG